MRDYDVIVIGAGAAGMMCAAEAGARGRRVALLDHARNPGEKIRISGGGRCNFTNLNTAPDRFLSNNPRFCVSALSRYRPADFIAMVDADGIAHHEKAAGQLFCDGSARKIIEMLVRNCLKAGVCLRPGLGIDGIGRAEADFTVDTADGAYRADAVVIATGGKSIPKLGATGFGYRIAEQFGHAVVEPRPALVPLTFGDNFLAETRPLAGISVDAAVRHGKTAFRDGLVFTHRGLSGPSILQISSYWREGDEIVVSLAPDTDVHAALRDARAVNPRRSAANALADIVPKRLARLIAERCNATEPLAALSEERLRALSEAVNRWRVKPAGSEGYRTAEVTLGGVDTDTLNSRTMESRKVPGLYFIGEVVDVTGWLGGYNFQWAWASGWAAGQAV